MRISIYKSDLAYIELFCSYIVSNCNVIFGTLSSFSLFVLLTPIFPSWLVSVVLGLSNILIRICLHKLLYSLRDYHPLFHFQLFQNDANESNTDIFLLQLRHFSQNSRNENIFLHNYFESEIVFGCMPTNLLVPQ